MVLISYHEEVTMTIADYLIAVLFGIVEGITEWIPVSSTGHMIILDKIFMLNVSDDFFSLFLVVIQLGAILAVIIIFWKEIWPFAGKGNNDPMTAGGVGKYIKKDIFMMWLKIVVACIPATIVGLLFDDIVDEYLYNFICVAIALIVFGIAFIVVEDRMKGRQFRVNSIEEITFKDAFLIGMFQLIAAIFPGTSRSGATIVGSLGMGIRRDIAAKFTFFLAIPVMLGASLLKILKYDGGATSSEWIILAIGMVVAFAVSFAIIKGLLAYIRKHDFKVFGWYRIILGSVLIILGICNVI